MPEVLLWRLLRSARPPIRRQHPLGDYVVDFYCAAAKMVFEVDGFSHDMGNRPQRDEQRQHWLEAQGVRVIRIPARDVLHDANACADSILRLCEDGRRTLHHSANALRSPSPSLSDGEDV